MSKHTFTRRGLLSAGLGIPLWENSEVRVHNARGDRVSFARDDRLLFAYQYSAARPKTYVHPFCAPDGSPLTIDGPPDHVHHRGLMLAWSGIRGLDFWGEENPVPHGQIVHQQFDRPPGDAPGAITSIEHWIAEGKVLIVERRTIRAPASSADAVWLDWTSDLEAAGEPADLATAGHEYNGLGIRFVPGLDEGSVLNSNGTAAIEKANGEAAKWCAYHGELDAAKTAGVAIFNHPENPRRPTPFFVMNQPFGYLSAAPTFHETLPLRKGRPVRLRYAVVSFFGKPTVRRLEEMYERWIGNDA